MNNFYLSLQSKFAIFYILITLAALGISWWSYRNLVPEISRFKRSLLISLRTIGIALIGVLLLEPIITHFAEKKNGTKLGVVMDLSSSMAYEDSNSNRYAEALLTLSDDLPGSINKIYYGFADSVTSLKGLPDPDQFTGQATDLARAITRPLSADPDDIGALLVVTDGANNIGLDPLTAAGSVDVPVYSLVVGGTISHKDIFLSQIDYPPVAYTNTEFAINAIAGAYGYEGKTVLLEIRDGSKVVASRKVILPADGAFTNVEFKMNFPEEGVRQLKATIAKADDEVSADNNTRNFSIKLLKDKIDILLMASSLNWEYTFLKKALSADQHLAIKSAVANSQGRFATNDMPTTLEGWQKIDLVICLDVDARRVGSQVNNLKSAIENGAGFLYLPGMKAGLNPLGGWDDILPLETTNRTNFEPGEFIPLPNKQAVARSVTGIDNFRWPDLHPLQFILTNLKLKPDAITFLDVQAANNIHLPILVGGRLSHGKTAAMTGFPWWPRYFQPALGNDLVKGTEHFWSNLVRWLVARDDLNKFLLATEKSVYKLGEPVKFQSTLFDDSYNLLSDATIHVDISDSAGDVREFQLTGGQPGQYAGIYGSPAAGKYNYDGYAIVDNDTLATAKGSFIVESFSLEMENLSANYPLMEQVSSLTGGKSYRPDDFASFPGDLRLNIKTADVFSEYRPTGHTYILIILIAAFALEWGIRKFSQLP